jgi:hypothetical protein
MKKGAKKYFKDLLETYKAYKRLSGGGYKFKVRALIATVIHLYSTLSRQAKRLQYFFY